MVTMYKCDICGKELMKNMRRVLLIRTYAPEQPPNLSSSLKVDLCEECAENLFDNLRGWVASKIRTSSATE